VLGLQVCIIMLSTEIFVVLGIKLRALDMLGKYSTTEQHPSQVFETMSSCVAQAGLKLLMLLTPPP
jgi:hypothetical protein